MKKEEIIRGALKLIEKTAGEKGLEVIDIGTGHAFDGSFWAGVFEDNSGIPEVKAVGDGYSIELRSFWGRPEVDVSRTVEDGEELIVLNYSDSVKNEEGKYEHTGNFRPHEVRVDARWDYRKCVDEVYEMIAFIEENGKENEVEDDDYHYCPSSTAGDHGPGNPWDAPGMSVRDFL